MFMRLRECVQSWAAIDVQESTSLEPALREPFSVAGVEEISADKTVDPSLKGIIVRWVLSVEIKT